MTPTLEINSFTIEDSNTSENFIIVSSDYIGEDTKEWKIEGEIAGLENLKTLVAKLNEIVQTLEK